jgi:hypothetical protein
MPTVEALVDAFVAAPLPPPATSLGPQSPLFFFHQRKTAGSSLRLALKAAANQSGLTTSIACYDVACTTWNVDPANTTSAIFAGHFTWSELHAMEASAVLDDAHPGSWKSRRSNVSCMTIFRDPMTRLQSCYYYRFVLVSTVLMPECSDRCACRQHDPGLVAGSANFRPRSARHFRHTRNAG